MMKMKALRTFRGKPGEGHGGERGPTGQLTLVKHGHEFTVMDNGRAKELEMRGLAVPVSKVAKPADEPQENKAANDGPLRSRGGRTGAAKPSSLSAQALPPEPSTSEPAEADADTSASTKVTGSRRGRKPSTRATSTGGNTGRASRVSKD